MSRLVFATLSLCCCACVTTGPRFEQDVATTFVDDDMRRLETDLLQVYYPAAERDAALRIAARAEECLRAYRALQRTQRPRDKALLFLTSSNYNNAYVSGQYGGEPLHVLNPLSTTAEIFNWYGLSSADVGDIACHELFHYAHFEQVENLWRGVNAVVGPVVSSQAFLERWFTEGAAQYYEGHLGRTVGRPQSPLYRGAFDSFVAAKGGIGAGDLSLSQRALSPFSGAYLTGLFFVDWLVQRSGEDKLWEVMDRQGRALFVPLGVALRFKTVYGRSLGALVDEFDEHLRDTMKPRERPAGQRVLREPLGQLARLAAHPASGLLAVVTSGNEEPARLRLIEPDGTVRVTQRLPRLTMTRDWVYAGPSSMSGLSFTADGRWLYLLNDDLIARGDTRAQLWKVDTLTGETTMVWKELGRLTGGGVSPDGRSFVTVEALAGGARIVDVDLVTLAKTTLVQAPPAVALAAPQWSLDGKRVAFSRLDRAGWNLVLREADGTLRDLTTDGAFNYGARWSDASHLVFARAAGPYLQAHRLDVDSGHLEQLTHAPFGLVDPAPTSEGVAFINRAGSGWSLDAVASPAHAEAEAEAGIDDEASPPPAPRGADAPVVTAAAGDDATPPTPDADGPVVAEAKASDDATTSAPDVVARSAEGGWYEPPTPTVEGDDAYSSFDHLFVPQLRAPGVASVSVDPTQLDASTVTLNAIISGRDRLDRHTWALTGWLTVPTMENMVQAAYTNHQLAPWTLGVSAGREAYPATARTAAEAFWTGAVTASRTIFTVPLSFGARTEVWQPDGAPLIKYIGPSLSVAYGAGESTGYGGAQRRLGLALDVAAYPKALGSDLDLVDARGSIDLAVPLPLSRRHSLLLSLAGRVLPGAPPGSLRVGGVGRGIGLWASNASVGRNGLPPSVFLPGSFVEAVRGYDDFSVRATAAGIAHARYRYSFIIDRGSASFLYLFPSLFFRQVDVEGFGAGAMTDATGGRWARSAGAALVIRTLWGGALPASLSYQFAWRFDHGLPPLHSVSLAFE